MKRTVRVYLIFAIVSVITITVLMMAVSCGSLDVNLHTTVEPSGDVIQSMKLTGTGMIGASLKESDTERKFREYGWQVTTDQSGDTITIEAVKEFKSNEQLAIPAILEDTPDLNQVELDVRNMIVLKEYSFEATLPASPVYDEDEDSEFSEIARTLVESMFSMSWTLTLPGEIVETNADSTVGNSATWYFDIDSFKEDRYMMVRTRYINWPLLIATVGGVIVLIVLVVLVSRRKSQKTGSWGGVYRS